jgi:hypothetical protein
MEYTEETMLRLVAEFEAKAAARPVKARYPVATEHSTTARGGQIISTSGVFSAGGRVAVVGDLVRYPDGSESRIVSGSGIALQYKQHSTALVGSAIENGDTITGPLHNGMTITQYADEPPIPGLLDLNAGASTSASAS